MRPDQIIHDGKLLSLVDHHLMSYYVEQTVPETKIRPNLEWEGGPISMDIWNDIKNICAYTYKEHKSECLIRLYYNEQSEEWRTAFFKQEMNGMTVNDEFDVAILTEEKCNLEDGFVEAGSVHHHCSSGAFQSSTDEKDEIGTPGIHITIGKLNNDKYEIHSRFKTPQGFSNVNLATFFEKPDWLKHIPEKYQKDIWLKEITDNVTSKGDPEAARKDWIERIVEKKIVQTTLWNNKSSRNCGYYNGDDYYGYGGYYNTSAYRSGKNNDDDKKAGVQLIHEAETHYEEYAKEYISSIAEASIGHEKVKNASDGEIRLNCEKVIRYVKSLINTAKTKWTDESDKIEWQIIRDDINQAREENHKICLTDYLRWINLNENYLVELCLEQIRLDNDEEETDTTDTETNTINSNSPAIL